GVVISDPAGSTGDPGLVVGSTLLASGITYFGTGSLEIDSGGTFDDSAIPDQTASTMTVIAPTGTAYATINDGLLNAGLNGFAIGVNLGSYGTLTLENAATVET